MKPRLPRISEVGHYLNLMDQSRIYSNSGPLSNLYKIKLSDYLGVDPSRIVLACNATIALQGAISISESKVWNIPNYSFAATAHAAACSAKEIIFHDVDIATFQVEGKVFESDFNFGFLPVMPFGAKIEFEKYRHWRNLVVDAAASLGAPRPDFSEMLDSWFVVYSLHATKVLGVGEGAFIVCGNSDSAKELNSWLNFGFKRNRISEITATNGKMSEIAAAYGLASMDQLEVEKEDWTSRLFFVKKLMKNSKYHTAVIDYEGFRPYWIVQFEDSNERSYVSDALNNLGIETRMWWPTPLTNMPAFDKYATADNARNSEFLAKTHLGLPFYRDLSFEQIELIVEKLHSVRSS